MFPAMLEFVYVALAIVAIARLADFEERAPVPWAASMLAAGLGAIWLFPGPRVRVPVAFVALLAAMTVANLVRRKSRGRIVK